MLLRRQIVATIVVSMSGYYVPGNRLKDFMSIIAHDDFYHFAVTIIIIHLQVRKLTT